MRISKKIIAIALSILMTVSMMPFTAFADALPTATVTDITDSAENELGLEAAYKYEATATAEGSKYADYLADFVITVDKDLPAGAIELWGKYDAALGDNTGAWTKLEYNEAIEADKEYHLLQMSGYWPITYSDVADIIHTFYCGVNGIDAAGAKMTVKLNLYEDENSEAIEIPGATVEYTFPVDADVQDEFEVLVEDTLDFNLYIQDSRAEKVVFEYNGSPEQEADVRKTKTVTKAEAEANDNIYYFSVKLAPAQAYDDVTYTVYDANNGVIRTKTTSLAEYLDVVINSEDYDPTYDFDVKYRNLAMAIYDYCKAAAEYFNYNAAAYAKPYYNETAQWKTTSFAVSDSTGKLANVSYVATSEPAVRFTVYGLTEEEAAEIGVSSNIGTAAFKKRGNDIVLEVKDIPASELHSTVVVNVEGLGEIKYTPLHYAYKTSELLNSLGRLGISIANYNYAAAEFFN